LERRGDVALILSELDLDDIEEVVWEPYHREGPVRPPRSLFGIFKALVVKRLRQIPSDRELYRRLWDDPVLREICDIEDLERPYHSSQLTRFRRNVGPERLEGIMKELVGELVEGDVVKGETVAMDATFIKAWSRRDPHEDSRGYSEPDARVGRDGRSYDLGYRAHISGDADSDLPVARAAGKIVHRADELEAGGPSLPQQAPLQGPQEHQDTHSPLHHHHATGGGGRTTPGCAGEGQMHSFFRMEVS